MDQGQIYINNGADVFGSDGDKVGTIREVFQNYIVVEKGWFFPTDYYIPYSAIANADEDRVYLNVTKDNALNQGWDTVPDTTTTGTYATGTTNDVISDTAGVGYTDEVVDRDVARATSVTEGETINVPVHEEELTATRRPVQRGEVRIEKDVVTEEQTLDVPVTEERVHVERHVVDREVSPDATAFQEETIEVPVRGEEVDVQKHTRVAEEISIGKEAHTETERVAGTVRHEEVHVDDNTQVVDADVTEADRRP